MIPCAITPYRSPPAFVALVPVWRHIALAASVPRYSRYVSTATISQLLSVVEANSDGVAIIDPELAISTDVSQRIQLALRLRKHGWVVICDTAQSREGCSALFSVAESLRPLDVILRSHIGSSPGREVLVGDSSEHMRSILALTAGGNIGMDFLAQLTASLSILPWELRRVLVSLFLGRLDVTQSADIARLCGWSKSSVHRALKEAGLESARSCVVAARVMHSLEELRDPDGSLARIAK